MIAAMLLSTSMLAQTTWNYISPMPGSKYINPENAIAFRHGDVLEISSVRSNAITVTCSGRGEIGGSFIHFSKEIHFHHCTWLVVFYIFRQSNNKSFQS